MAEGDIGNEIESLIFEDVACGRPAIIHVAGEIYAVAYTGEDAHGWVKTFSISAAGVVSNATLGDHEFSGVNSQECSIAHVHGEVYAVAFRDNVNDGQIATVKITSAGVVSGTGKPIFEFDGGEANEPYMIKIAANVFAIVYRDSSVHGKVVTVDIADDGTVGGINLVGLLFDASRCVEPHIVLVVGDIYAIAYQGVDDHGWIVAVDIDPAGTIVDPEKLTVEFDAGTMSGAHILQITDSVYVIAYINSAGDGDLVTVEIDDTGVIGPGIIDDQVYETAAAIESYIIPISGTIYAITYRGTQSDGWLKTWSISDVGVIAATMTSQKEFDVLHGEGPVIIHVAGNTYAIAYTNTDGFGEVISIPIETVTAAAVTQHLLLMGIG